MAPLVISQEARLLSFWLVVKEVNETGGLVAIDFPHIDGPCTFTFTWFGRRPTHMDGVVIDGGQKVQSQQVWHLNSVGPPPSPTTLDE